jgi:hypothetical protein
VDTLDSVHSEAAELSKRGNPRTAIEDCFGKYADSTLFSSASAPSQEQFLFDYIDACTVAASVADPNLHKQYLSRAVNVGRQYAKWYTSYTESHSLADSNQRIAVVVAVVGDSLIELGQWSKSLDWFESWAADDPEYLANSVTLHDWDKALRYDEASGEPLSNSKIQARIVDEPSGPYADDWRTFQGALEKIKNIGEIRREANRELQKVKNVLKETPHP